MPGKKLREFLGSHNIIHATAYAAFAPEFVHPSEILSAPYAGVYQQEQGGSSLSECRISREIKWRWNTMV